MQGYAGPSEHISLGEEASHQHILLGLDQSSDSLRVIVLSNRVATVHVGVARDHGDQVDDVTARPAIRGRCRFGAEVGQEIRTKSEGSPLHAPRLHSTYFTVRMAASTAAEEMLLAVTNTTTWRASGWRLALPTVMGKEPLSASDSVSIPGPPEEAP